LVDWRTHFGHAVAVNDDAVIEDILRFWFGDLRGPEDVDRSKMKMWWMGGDAIDAEIRQRFGSKVADALDGKLGAWQTSPRGALALVILLDQFTRNVGRGTPGAFAGDRAALEVCLAAIARGDDRKLRPIERAFLYMPMMHAEDRDVARRSIETFEQLSRDVAALGGEYPDFKSHALQHADIVLRFGRFPHRNEVLGRTPSPDESEFLASGGPSFGQAKR
jgi:uncharacterized protein (DUF924 family)